MEKLLQDILEAVQKTDWLSFYGSIASLLGLIGLAISIRLLYIAQQVKDYINIYKRIPQILVKITGSSSRIGDMLNNYDGTSHKLKVELARCLADLKWLKDNSLESEKDNIDRVMADISEIRKVKDIPEEKIETIHSDMEWIIQSITNWRFDVLLEETLI